MKASIATVTLKSMSPLSQSQHHDAPFLEGEKHEAHDKRTWKSKAHLDANGVVMLPAHGLHQCFATAAKYSKKKIAGAGAATWTKKFESGITLLADASTGVTLGDNDYVDIFANLDGVRGGSKRGNRRFPSINAWESTFDVIILDPIITQDIFTEMVEMAGMFIGLGRFRPEKMGTNGRFTLKELIWADNRQIVT